VSKWQFGKSFCCPPDSLGHIPIEPKVEQHWVDRNGSVTGDGFQALVAVSIARILRDFDAPNRADLADILCVQLADFIETSAGEKTDEVAPKISRDAGD
jgi:hypothetical protein